MAIRIANGVVYDPVNNENGINKTVNIKDGKISGDSDANAETLDASGCVVMAGGVDIHSHIAGPLARLARGAVPTPSETGRLYAEMGYTTVIEPAVHPSLASAAHEESGEIPIIDKGLLVILTPQELLIKLIAKGDLSALRAVIAWLVNSAKAYSVKLVNPGGGFTNGNSASSKAVNMILNGFNVTPAEIMIALVDAVNDLNLPHPLHLHLDNLGTKSGCDTAISAIKALDGRKAHMTHIQFNSYGSRGKHGFASKSDELARVINLNRNITVDIGQVVFGPAMAVTADLSVLRRLSKVTGIMWEPLDAGCGDLCGCAPYEYMRESFVNSVQWATGLELFLLIDDPWQVSISTDHPNAGPFTSYPQIIKLLMDNNYRDEKLAEIHGDAREASELKSIGREYSLYEIAIITRAGPAKTLGLANKGHLGEGADADIAVYQIGDDYEEMFSKPKWVIKNGKIVVKDGKTVESFDGKTFYTEAPISSQDGTIEPRELMNKYCPGGLTNFPVKTENMPWLTKIPEE